MPIGDDKPIFFITYCMIIVIYGDWKNKIFLMLYDYKNAGGEKMGLFSNNKKLCPVCGEATPRLFPTKVEGTPICKECAKKIFLPDGMLNNMSMDSFMQYMNYYEQNQPLRERFASTYEFFYGMSSTDLILDASNRLFRLKNDDNALVLEASCLKSFCISEDGKPLFESMGNALRCYESDVVEKVSRMHTAVEQFKARRQHYEFMQDMERRKEEEAKRKGETYQKRYMSAPHFDNNEPFKNFCIELEIDHPYWGRVSEVVYGPKFNSTYPSVDTYICDYQNAAERMHELAMNLMQFMCPGAKEIHGADAEAAPVTRQPSMAAAGTSAIEEIKQYKELLDAGIITEEEFAIKKRQLLGL